MKTTLTMMKFKQKGMIFMNNIKELADWYYSQYINNQISEVEYEDALYAIGYYDSNEQ